MRPPLPHLYALTHSRPNTRPYNLSTPPPPRMHAGFKRVGTPAVLESVGVSYEVMLHKMRNMALLMLGSKASGAPVPFADIQAALDITPEEVRAGVCVADMRQVVWLSLCMPRGCFRNLTATVFVLVFHHTNQPVLCYVTLCCAVLCPGIMLCVVSSSCDAHTHRFRPGWFVPLAKRCWTAGLTRWPAQSASRAATTAPSPARSGRAWGSSCQACAAHSCLQATCWGRSSRRVQLAAVVVQAGRHRLCTDVEVWWW